MEPLALKYRPRTFDDLVGQRAAQVVLRQMVTTRTIPPAILLDGPRGTGKTTTARILAAAVNCDATPVPCGQCPSCKSVYDGSSLDVIEIDAASNGLVDDIRALRSQVMYRTAGRYRIVALDEAQGISRAGFNALLKTFEEPPLDTVFILLTTERGKIPDTILSRCMPFSFHRIPVADIAARLAHIAAAEGFTVTPEVLAHIAERADGGMRDAIMVLDQISRVDITTLTEFAELFGDIDAGPTLAAAVMTGNHATVHTVLTGHLQRGADPTTAADSLAATLRDLLVLRTGGVLHWQGISLTQRRTLADRADTATLVGALKILWDLRTKVRPGDNARVSLDLAMTMTTELFASRTTPPAPGRLTLDQMKDGQ